MHVLLLLLKIIIILFQSTASLAGDESASTLECSNKIFPSQNLTQSLLHSAINGPTEPSVKLREGLIYRTFAEERQGAVPGDLDIWQVFNPALAVIRQEEKEELWMYVRLAAHTYGGNFSRLRCPVWNESIRMLVATPCKMKNSLRWVSLIAYCRLSPTLRCLLVVHIPPEILTNKGNDNSSEMSPEHEIRKRKKNNS